MKGDFLMYDLFAIINGDEVELQTNSYPAVKDYIADSDVYMLTNEEGTILDCKGIHKILELAAKKAERCEIQSAEICIPVY